MWEVKIEICSRYVWLDDGVIIGIVGIVSVGDGLIVVIMCGSTSGRVIVRVLIIGVRVREVLRFVITVISIIQIGNGGCTVPFAKGQAEATTLTTKGQYIYTGNNFSEHGELSPTVPIEDTTVSEAEEIIPALFVPVGQRAMAPVVRVAIELLCSSCV
jgi:hypothetical protein